MAYCENDKIIYVRRRKKNYLGTRSGTILRSQQHWKNLTVKQWDISDKERTQHQRISNEFVESMV